MKLGEIANKNEIKKSNLLSLFLKIDIKNTIKNREIIAGTKRIVYSLISEKFFSPNRVAVIRVK